MKEIQILNNGDALYDIRRKINENFELVHEKATTEPLVSFGVNEGNETNGVADLIEITEDTLNFKVGGEYPNLVMTSGDGFTTEIRNVNPLHLQNLADGEYTVLVDGSNSTITDAEFYSQLLEPENPNVGDVWFNGENAVSFVADTPQLKQISTSRSGLRCMANLGDFYLCAGASNIATYSDDGGQTWQDFTLDTGDTQKDFVGCEVYDNKIFIVSSDGTVRYTDATKQISFTQQITSSVAVLKFKKVNGIYMAATNKGIYQTTDMVTWVQQVVANNSLIRDITFVNGKYYCLTGEGAIYSSANLSSWDNESAIYTNATCLEMLDNNNLLIGTNDGLLYKFTITPRNITSTRMPITSAINDIKVFDNGAIFVAGGSCFYTTKDFTTPIQLVNTGMTHVFIHDKFVVTNSGIIFEILPYGQWVAYGYIPIGEITISGGEVTYFTTYPYNTNGLFEATTSTFGLLRTAAEPDELNCQCSDAVLTPSNLYSLQNFRLGNTEYNVDAKVGCPYHHNLQLKCTQSGTTSHEALNTRGYLEPGTTIEDGSVIWEVEELGTGSGGSGFNLFDTKISDHILKGEEALGWALQGTYVYKEGVAGLRTGYADFYNRCLDEYESATEKGYLSANVDIVGLLTNTQGVLSGFSDSANYATLPTVFNPETNIWEAVFKFTTGTDVTTVQNIFSSMSGVDGKYSGFMLQVHNGGLVFKGSTDAKTWGINITGGVVSANSTYWIKGEFTGNAYNLYISTNGSTFQLINTASSTAPFANIAVSRIGVYGNLTSNPFKGSIDLNESYININGERWWEGAVTIQKNSNGHKFYDISEKPYIDSIYETTGIADYYGIDLVNERIFLPRDKYFAVTGDVAVAGNGMTLGLTDGTQDLGVFVSSSGNGIGAFKGTATVGTSASSVTGANNLAKVIGVTTDSTKSGIEGQLKPNENKYLYICVGNTKVESAVSNVTEITTSENDTLPLFHNFYSKEDMTTTGAYVNASLGSWLSGNVYATAYQELVNKLGTDNVKANTDTYTDYDFVVNQDDVTFRLPLKNGDEDIIDYASGTSLTFVTPFTVDKTGYYFLGIDKSGTNKTGRILVNGNIVTETNHSNTYSWNDTLIKLTKGDVVTWSSQINGIIQYFEPQGNGNLYYKVANALTNLELLDVAKVTNDLNACYKRNAGDNSDLSGLGMPSNKYIDLAVGASGTSYTAPANGYFQLLGIGTDQNNACSLYIYLAENGETSATSPIVAKESAWAMVATGVILPVAKGQVVKIGYDRITFTHSSYSNLGLKFIYAEGEV